MGAWGTPEMSGPWFDRILGLADKIQGAAHGEGYWVDHWIYNLDLLESLRLPDGGFAASEKFYRLSRADISGFSEVNWGGISRKRQNPYVSVEALSVLKAAGR